MDYPLSLTSRLVFLGGFSLLLLMVLMFLLGVQAGRGLPQEKPDQSSAALPAYAASEAARAASMAAGTASQRAGQALKSVQMDLMKGKP
jgi:hypothetical protein